MAEGAVDPVDENALETPPPMHHHGHPPFSLANSTPALHLLSVPSSEPREATQATADEEPLNDSTPIEPR